MRIPINNLKSQDLSEIVKHCSIELETQGLEDFLEADITARLSKYLEDLNILVVVWDMEPSGIHALFVSDQERLNGIAPNCNGLIAINRRLLDEGDHPRVRAILKQAFCHEVAHICLKHPPSFMMPEKVVDESYTRLRNALMSFAKDERIRADLEGQAELFSAVLGFWPRTKFLLLFNRTKADFRDIAAQFKMPVDCAVKWAIYSLDIPMHYLKHNLRTSANEDFYVSTEAIYKDFPWQFQSGKVFEDARTTAAKCKTSEVDQSGITVAPNDISFFCRGLFMKRGPDWLAPDDKVIICGFPKSFIDLLAAGEEQRR